VQQRPGLTHLNQYSRAVSVVLSSSLKMNHTKSSYDIRPGMLEVNLRGTCAHTSASQNCQAHQGASQLNIKEVLPQHALHQLLIDNTPPVPNPLSKLCWCTLGTGCWLYVHTPHNLPSAWLLLGAPCLTSDFLAPFLYHNRQTTRGQRQAP
jgi:hypothetical protein